jgi:DNA-directed RNA polymerase subunit RPC12/RpoP
MAVIKFRCPNGHPLAAPANRVGKAGQCPRCQTRFVVPAATDKESAETVVSARDTSDENGQWPSREYEADAVKFMFLCPNGHRLFGPPSLQGRPGQCPQCNSRFLIPDVHPAAVPDNVDADDVLSQLGGRSELTPDTLLSDDVAVGPRAGSASVIVPEEPPPPPMPVSCHPLAQIIRRVGAETRGAGPLEIRLSDGTVLVAESFSAELSQHEYGVFAVCNAPHASSVVVVPWDQVTRVTINQPGDLPLDLRRAPAANQPPPDRPR